MSICLVKWELDNGCLDPGNIKLVVHGELYSDWYMYIVHVYNSNRTKRSPIQAVIIQVINKIGWLHCEGILIVPFHLKKYNS